ESTSALCSADNSAAAYGERRSIGCLDAACIGPVVLIRPQDTANKKDTANKNVLGVASTCRKCATTASVTQQRTSCSCYRSKKCSKVIDHKCCRAVIFAARVLAAQSRFNT